MRRLSKYDVSTDSYLITVINPRRRGLRPLLDENDGLTGDGQAIVAILEGLGYEVEVEVEDEY